MGRGSVETMRPHDTWQRPGQLTEQSLQWTEQLPGGPARGQLLSERTRAGRRVATRATAAGEPLRLPESSDDVSWPSQCERLARLN